MKIEFYYRKKIMEVPGGKDIPYMATHDDELDGIIQNNEPDDIISNDIIRNEYAPKDKPVENKSDISTKEKIDKAINSCKNIVKLIHTQNFETVVKKCGYDHTTLVDHYDGKMLSLSDLGKNQDLKNMQIPELGNINLYVGNYSDFEFYIYWYLIDISELIHPDVINNIVNALPVYQLLSLSGLRIYNGYRREIIEKVNTIVSQHPTSLTQLYKNMIEENIKDFYRKY
jgi:hypothetical protein